MSETAAVPLYVDTSAVLRAVLESGSTPEMETRLQRAPALVTSRLALVESSRAVLRVRLLATQPETRLSDAEREIEAMWGRCEVWEITTGVCELARTVAPRKALRTLDAIHLATFLLARRQIEHLELLTADDRLRDAALGI
jgi:predicted nucleic acid-binding protein